MKTKKFVLPAVLLVGLLIAYAAFSVIFCYNTKPAVSEGEFPFSITYEYLGETKTISGVYVCKFHGSETIFREHNRYWDGESIIEYNGEYDIPNVVFQNEEITLAVFENMSAGYFMGDPLYKDYYANYGLEGGKGNVEVDHAYDVITSGGSGDMILVAGNYDIWFDLTDTKVYIMTPGKPISEAEGGTAVAPEPEPEPEPKPEEEEGGGENEP